MIATHTKACCPIRIDFNPESPEPGLYRDVPFEQYLSVNCLSASTIGNRLDGGSWLAAMEKAKRQSTASQESGSLLHELILEPARLGATMVLGPVNPRTEKEYGRDTKAWREFVEDHPGKSVVGKQEFENWKKIVARVRNHKYARHYLLHEQMAGRELSGIFEIGFDRPDGERRRVLAKFRPDAMWADAPLLVDVKTTARDLTPQWLRQSVNDYGWGRTAALYTRGMASLTGIPLQDWRYVFVMIQRCPPFDVLCCPFGEDELDYTIGWTEIEEHLADYEACRANSRWLGAGEQWADGYQRVQVGQVPVGYPEWRRRQFLEAEDTAAIESEMPWDMTNDRATDSITGGEEIVL